MSLMVYGANGYSGELIARRAVECGLRPVVAGRRAEPLSALASELGLQARAFPLDQPAAVDRGLTDIRVVLNCAGPFSRTAEPLAAACLRARAHYLDITGEVDVFAALAARDAEARAAGVMLLPGVGFDVVPTDCLAAHLHHRLPSATHLRLAFRQGARASRGTSLSALEAAGRRGLIRRNGVLTPVPLGHRTVVVDFGRGPTRAIAIPWGDVFTASITTGIANIEVYIAVPLLVRMAVRGARWLRPLLSRSSVQRFLAGRIRAGAPGPSPEARQRGKSLIWGEATDGDGRRVISRMVTPEGYELTRLSAVALAQRVLAGEAPAGFQTPARAYGRDLVLSLPAVKREDVV
jgi:short subunit dehydrogenase-like uncharacterized protein